MTPAELKSRMLALPTADTPPPSFTWARHRYELVQHVKNSDLAQCLRWSTVVGTMVVGDVPYIREELSALESHGDWKALVRGMAFGGETLIDGWISANMVHQCYHLSLFEQLTGRLVSEMDSIIEIGGGYGAMAIAARRFGFGGPYYIYDFPEFSLLQEYYLSNVGIQNVEFVTDSQKIPNTASMLIGLWSIGEMPIADRSVAEGDDGHYLFTYVDVWDGYDNYGWFNQFAANRPRHKWYTRAVADSSLCVIGARQ